MKIFHTADWHLGKLVQGVYMTEDQRYILQQFLAYIDEEQPDVVIIAGDLYDRSVPKVEAVNLLDEVLAQIVLKRNIPVLAIAGNHDSPQRVHFGSELLQQAGLHIVGEFQQDMAPVVLTDAHGEVHFHLIPFAEPEVVREALGVEVKSYDDAMRVTVEHVQSSMKPDVRHVAIAHAFVTPYGEAEDNTSESERPLSIGGTDYVSAEHFTPFHYVALGHLHKAHKVHKVLHDRIRYAGSPLKYSKSEAKHEKGFYVVDMQENGDVQVEKRVFKPRRDLRIVEGKMEEILRHPESADYVYVLLTDEVPVMNAMEQVRTVYPNALHIERRLTQVVATAQELIAREKMDDVTLFQAFYKQMTKQEPTELMDQLFKEALNELLADERQQ